MARRFDLVAYLKLFRFPLVFTAMGDSVAGFLLAFNGNPLNEAPWGSLALLAISSACLYAFGMALNDIADRQRDATIAPSRVLPSGRLSPRAAVVAAGAVLLLSVIALIFVRPGGLPNHAWGEWARFIAWGLIVAAIVCYNCLFKVPPVMGLVRACNFALGYVARRDMCEMHEIRLLAVLVAPEFIYVTALTFVSTLEDGALNVKRLWFGVGTMMAAALLAGSWIRLVDAFLSMMYHGDSRGFGFDAPWFAIATGAVLALWLLRRALSAKDKKGVMLIVRDGIGGILVLNAALLLSVDQYAEAALVASLILPAAASVAIFKKLA